MWTVRLVGAVVGQDLLVDIAFVGSSLAPADATAAATTAVVVFL